ncbi:MAG TPA: riboflavin synthase [Cytophagaceae bacterium]|jgi:riboflavin synthase|nr:riboflavin synthase [Cytophagaceae bacterium]
MFTGIVETIGIVREVKYDRSNLILTVASSISKELKIDQSVSHNGACLTVVAFDNETHQLVLIDETLQKTNFNRIKVGDEVNLERCLPFNGRLDGHMVQGHVDLTGVCTAVIDQNGSWKYIVEYDAGSGFITVPKGSVCLNGISLTVVDSGPGRLSVAIIPYTFEHTNMKNVQIGSKINIEFDIIGKYITQYAALYKCEP